MTPIFPTACTTRRILRHLGERLSTLKSLRSTLRVGVLWISGALIFLAGIAIAPVTWWQDKPILLLLSALVMMLLYPSNDGEG